MEKENRRRTWLYTAGGPFALLPGEQLEAWEGTDSPTNGRTVEANFRWNPQPGAVATDYDRACDVVEFAKVLRVGSGWSLIISAEEEGLALLHNEEAVATFLLFSGKYSASTPDHDEDGLAKFLADALSSYGLDWQPLDAPVSFQQPLYLIDAADPGLWAQRNNEGVALALSPGTCVLETAHFTFTNEHDAWTLIRLRKVGAQE